jgi:hypothetical protein
MQFGEHKSFYAVTVEQAQTGLQMTLELKPNFPIYRKALGVEWPDELDDKTGEGVLPILSRALADIEGHAADYRAMSERDWFGYDAVLGFLRQAASLSETNPSARVQLRLNIGSAELGGRIKTTRCPFYAGKHLEPARLF